MFGGLMSSFSMFTSVASGNPLSSISSNNFFKDKSQLYYTTIISVSSRVDLSYFIDNDEVLFERRLIALAEVILEYIDRSV